MNILTINIILLFTFISWSVNGQWPMSNDPAFDATVGNPAYSESKGPKILIDGGHHNFFVQWDFIKPFSDLATADGYQAKVNDKVFTPDYLAEYDIVMIITALPFDFTTKKEVTTEKTFTDAELKALELWVKSGGSLLVFSEHAPLDQAINPLLSRFGISSSVGTVADKEHYDKNLGRQGWIVFSRDNGYLNEKHPIVKGRDDTEAVNSLVTFGGSSLTGDGFSNLLQLSPTAKNLKHSTGVGPIGMGNSQALAGNYGKGRIVALGDSNGFVAMNFSQDDGAFVSAGMNTKNHDWKQFVLNTLHWLSGELELE
jgi:hypothetical protein